MNFSAKGPCHHLKQTSHPEPQTHIPDPNFSALQSHSLAWRLQDDKNRDCSGLLHCLSLFGIEAYQSNGLAGRDNASRCDAGTPLPEATVGKTHSRRQLRRNSYKGAFAGRKPDHQKRSLVLRRKKELSFLRPDVVCLVVTASRPAPVESTWRPPICR